MRAELIGLERLRAVVRHADVGQGFRDGRVGQAQQRRLVHRRDDVDVHWHVGAEARGANAFRQSHATVHFHRAGVDALHLGQEGRGFLLLDERAADAALTEVDGERQAHGPGADDEHLCVHEFLPVDW